MIVQPRFLLPFLMLGLVALVLVGGLLPPRATAGGLPPAGTDTLDASAEISVVSLLGAETISFTGTVTIERSDPRIDGGVEVVDAEIVSMDLEGTSVVGPISVTESVTLASIGEIRSLQSGEKFPASSFFDSFISVVVPGNPAPTLTLHNDEAIHLVPMSGGSEVPLTAWPPSGVTYQDEPEPCIPLLPALPAQVCVTMVSVTFGGPQPPPPTPAPTPTPTIVTPLQPLEGPTLSVAADGPSGRHPADLLGLAPTATTAFPCLELGLTADGCDDGADGDQDDLNALSFGADFTLGDAVTFSVAAGSAGVLGSTVRSQADCEPAQPQADAFSTSLNGSNVLLFDGDGQAGGCPTATAFGLLEIPDSDDLDALDKHSATFVDIEGDGQPDEAVYFSLAAGSSTLASLSRSSADILWTVGGSQPGVYALAGDIGLQTGDDIDALCVADAEDAFAYDPEIDSLAFSLAAGSPTLATLGASPADVLIAGPQVLVAAAELGLEADDDLNAMMCGPGLVLTRSPTPMPTPTSPAVSPTPTPTTMSAVSPTPTPTTMSAVSPTPTPTDTSEVLPVALPKVGTGGTTHAVSERLLGVLLPGLAALSGLVLFGLGVRRLRRP